MPKISVIMPAYNHEKFIGEAIESVLNQSFKDFEFIIINDGSTDNSEKITKKYEDRRIKYFKQKNRDAPYTINKGISLAKGKYISIINSDDKYEANRLKNLIEIAEDGGYQFIFSDIVFIDEFSNEIRNSGYSVVNWSERVKNRYSKCKSLLHTLLLGNISFTTSNFFFNKKIIKDVGEFSTNRYTHDYDFLLRTLSKFNDKVLYLKDNKYLYYRIHEKNTLKESHNKLNFEVYKLLINNLQLFLSEKENINFINSINNILQVNSKHYDLNNTKHSIKKLNEVTELISLYSNQVDNENDYKILNSVLERINLINNSYYDQNSYLKNFSRIVRFFYYKIPLKYRETKLVKYINSLYFRFIKKIF
ncbi:MAG: glycosyltransferase family 2 protein [Thermodesulfobacteriota bacterium]